MARTALVTGATGTIGAALVPALLAAGWAVRVLTRHPEKLDAAWRDRVAVTQGDAGDAAVLDRALPGADVAYYLVHSMEAGATSRPGIARWQPPSTGGWGDCRRDVVARIWSVGGRGCWTRSPKP